MSLSLSEQYTDQELYQRLGFAFPPSDRELEIKIISYIKKYSPESESSEPELFSFFHSVYDHFFSAEDEGTEGFDNMDKGKVKSPATNNSTDPDKDTKDVTVVTSVPYTRDKLNPILKQTIQRVISIDSKYRNVLTKISSSKFISTNFTIDLSEPLKDVLSIKLYSFQIPNTWYTISKDYGANFFYLKGNSPGINTGNFDYQVAVTPGNYSAAELVKSISASMQLLKKIYTDVSFGNTDISYNTYNSTATFSIDVQNAFDQSQYYIDWVVQPNPSRNSIVPGSSVTFSDIPSFLGYNSQIYSLSSIYSGSLPLPNPADTTQNVYQLNALNSSVVIFKTDLAGLVDMSFNLTLSLGPGFYSRNQLQTNFVSVIQSSPYLTSDSSFSRVSASATTTAYMLRILLNRVLLPVSANHSIGVLFPTEGVPNPIWTGNNSCFHFLYDASGSLFNRVSSENTILPNNFEIGPAPTIFISCSTTNYVDASNDYLFTATTIADKSVSLANYISGVNEAFGPSHITDTGHLQFTNTSPFLTGTALPTLQFNFNLLFQTNEYYIDLSNSVLGFILYDVNSHVPPSPPYLIDLSANPVVYSNLTQNNTASLRIPVGLNLCIVKPKYRRNGFTHGNNSEFDPNTMTYGDSSGVNFIVPFVSSFAPFQNKYIYYNRDALALDINNSFRSYSDTLDYPVTGSLFSFGNLKNDNTVDMSLNMNVSKILTQNDYDASLSVYNPVDVSNSWVTNLGFNDTTYHLIDYYVPTTADSYVNISGELKISVSSLVLTPETNYFYIRPNPSANGLATTAVGQQNPAESFYNDIRVQIDVGTYNTDSLLNAIQAAFLANPLISSSTLSYLPFATSINVPQYAVIDIVVNKVFTAADYILDFYDPVSFVQCYIGDSSVRNTTWDTTIGWMLGFRDSTQYSLSSYPDPTFTGRFVASITAEYSVNVNLYSYFLITVDDFNQCRLNDGLVSITKPDSSVALPIYSSYSNFICDTTGQTVAAGSTQTNQNNLTLNQVYAINQTLSARGAPIPKSFSQGPFIKDIFGIIPLKTAGLANGAVYSDYGGSLQQQERIYFGPVNIRRLQIQLYNNQGAIMDLNGSDWSFSFICEQLYQQSSVTTTK